MDRREFLRRAAMTGSGLALGAALPSTRLLDGMTAAGAATQPATLRDIEHVVIVMQENRSYDHYFGTYRKGLGFDDRSAAAMKAYAQAAPTRVNTNPKGVLLPWHLDTQHANAACSFDVNHEWNAQHYAWNNGANDKFLFAQASRAGSYNTMGYYTRADLPLYYALADNFTLCDHYFCSALGPTGPNRHYATSATIDPMGKNGGPVPTGEPDFTAPKGQSIVTAAAKYTWPTMPEQLQNAGISWKVYQAPGANLSTLAANSVLMRYRRFLADPKSDLYRNAFLPLFPHDFVADVASGNLPAVSWLQPKSPGYDEHPPYAPNAGEQQVGIAVRALLEHPRVWKKTVLFITYDENGGFFDHVAPPTAPPGTPDEFIPAGLLPAIATGVTGPIGLGFRVPTIVVSPFSHGGKINSDVFDHTSLLRFLETRFGVEVPNLSAWRRHTTGDLTSALNLAAPDYSVPALPDPVSTTPAVATQCFLSTRQLLGGSPPPYPQPARQQLPGQEPGRRRGPRSRC
jgi:phospholipase C